jgi:hypothetical protein
MPITAYKMFGKGLVCRGYKFEPHGTHITKEANCAKNGFHCAEDPLDCLSYYHDFSESECWEVEAGGDIDEDDNDSKISCTEMRLIRPLTLEEFVEAALVYMSKHPFRAWNRLVKENTGEAENGFVIVRGSNPIASGQKSAILALVKEDLSTHKIVEVSMLIVGRAGIKPDVYYDITGHARRG